MPTTTAQTSARTTSARPTSARPTSARPTRARTTTGRRAALATAALAVLGTVAAAGCGGPDDQPDPGVSPQPSASPGHAGALGAGPGPVPDDGAQGQGQPSGQGGTQAQDPGYPDTTPAYAEAVLAAWHGADIDRLGQLTTELVHDQIVQIPGPPASDWTRIQCDGGDCLFYNGDGDYLVLHIQLGKLGQAHATSHVSFDAVSYPQHHLDYLKEFVKAWQVGNLARMHALALPEVVEVYQQRTPGQVTNYGQAGGGGGLSIVVVTTVGAEIETHIATTLLGGPQAIRKAVPEL